MTRKRVADGRSLPAHRPERILSVGVNISLLLLAGLSGLPTLPRLAALLTLAVLALLTALLASLAILAGSAAYLSPYRLPCLLLHCLQNATWRAAAGL
jgi:hypothetical protein